MKPGKLLALIVMVITAGIVQAQVGLGTTDPKAALDVTSTDSGILIPRMTAEQVELIATPTAGELVFSTSGTGPIVNTVGFWYFDGSTWLPIIASSSTGENIYNSDGTLLSNRTVMLMNQNLNIGPTRLFINGATGNVGINTDSPSERLDVGGDLRIRNLSEGNVVTTAQGELSLDNGLVYKYGDIRFSYLATDHDGWYALDGRPLTGLPPDAQIEAANLGIAGNLPDATGLYIKAGTPGTLSGATSVTLTKANLPDFSMTGSTFFSSHSHNIVSPGFTVIKGTNAVNTVPGNTWGSQLAGGAAAGSTSKTKSYTSTSAGGHSHSLTASTGGSGTAISLNPTNVQFNYFIYLGK
jgi:hypothetical protein